MIADAIIERTEALCPPFSDANCHVGVLGTGAIGGALIQKLARRGHTVFHFGLQPWDSSTEFVRRQREAQERIHRLDSSAEVVTRATVLFGCAGKDVLAKDCDIAATAGKWFASCGSMDVEFASLIKTPGSKLQRPHNPFSTVVVPTSQGHAYVLNGGFPVNFDRNQDSVPLSKIQFTRALNAFRALASTPSGEKPNWPSASVFPEWDRVG